MYYDAQIIQQMIGTLELVDGAGKALGGELCRKVLPCGARALVLAFADCDMRSALELLMARREGSAAYPELECSAERLRYLCLAVAEEMRRAAIGLAGSVPCQEAEQVRELLMRRQSGAARAVLCVTSGFEYNPGLREFEDGFRPEPGYAAIRDALPEEYRESLARLAYIAARLPTG